MKSNQVEAEVDRLIAAQVAPGLRFPRRFSELQVALLDRRGRGLSPEERSWFQKLSSMPRVFKVRFEDAIFDGGGAEEFQAILDDAAAEEAASLIAEYGDTDGAEIARLLGQTRDR